MAKVELSKAEKKAARTAKRAASKERRGQFWQAFQMQRKDDKALIPILVGIVVAAAAVFFLVGMLFGAQWLTLPLGVVVGVLLGVIIFGRRLQRSVYSKADGQPGAAGGQAMPFGMKTAKAQFLLCIAGVGCCVAMAMPQVHIVAYCGDLGYGAARGAEMLSLMLACGIVSRLVSGFVCDRIGGLRTLLLGSVLQGVALLLFLPFDGLASLYVIAALFGLFQGGIVPSYAIIVREHFPASEAGTRVGAVIMATMIGMALGGWLSGKIFDLTGSYHAAFINGIGWNLLNVSIILFLLYRVRLCSRAGTLQPNLST